MSDPAFTGSGPAATPSRAGLRAVIPRRPKVGAVTGLLLALAFALAATPILRIDLWLVSSGSLQVRAKEPSPVTVRVPLFAGWDGRERIGGGGILIARGETADPETARIVAELRSRTPHGLFGDLAYFAVVLALTAIYTRQLRRSTRGRLLRTQLVLLGMLLVTIGVVKALMLLTPISILAVPVALLALSATMAVDREAGVATGVLASMVVGLLVPFDVGVTAILLVQALTAVLLLPDRIRLRWRVAIGAGLAAAVTGVLAYGVVHYLTRGSAPVDELSRLGSSSWVAAAVGGVIAAFTAAAVAPALQAAVGEITDAKLVELDNFSHPLLKQIAEKSPGTWQHSLAMANMAEIAANVIGANARLVRVGALFHDLGKSLQPKYFIENVESGEQSPHDRLPPEVSCDAIFAHVTEGIAVARKNRLPERIIDFMHMHHGDGVLEYFWAKCQEQGNPRALSTEDFRYPGVPPQSRETAILAICDAVEAASRTLRRPDQQAIGGLVQRIVYGKLHLGQLDDSGLSMSDLRKISDSLRETIKHAHHGRIEYPWQREERERENATVHERPSTAQPVRESGPTITQRLMDEPRLDSLDAPRPPWAAGADTARRRKAPVSGEEATVQVPSDPAIALPTSSPGLPPGLAIEDTVSLRAEPPMTRTQQLAHGPTAQVAAAVPEPGLVTGPISGAITAQRMIPTEAMESALSTGEIAAADTVSASAAEIAAAAAEPPEIVPLPAPRWSNTFAAAAEQALEHVPNESRPAPEPAQPRRRRSSEWGQRLADRIDALIEGVPDDELATGVADEPVVEQHVEQAAQSSPAADGGPELEILDEQAVPVASQHAETARRQPPPPPRSRKPQTTLEVDGDDVEATLEVTPSVRSAGTGPIVGPPPATRAAPIEPLPDRDEPSDDDVTVVPARPHSTMLPPRARHGKPSRD